MKLKLYTFAVICFIAVMNVHSKERDAGLNGSQIVDKMNEIMNVDSARSKMTMTITTSSGQKRTFIYDSYSKNKGEKTLMRYLEPSRAKGQAILMLNNADDIWAYFPRTRRVRKLASHAKRQKMEGSDFSYEDMGSNDSFINDYVSTLLSEEKKEGYKCYKLELKKKPSADVGYSKMIVWVIKKHFIPIVIDYYDLDEPDLLKKTLVQYDIQNIDNIPTAMKIVMYNKLDDTSTKMELLEVDYDVQLEDKIFSERNLKK